MKKIDTRTLLWSLAGIVLLIAAWYVSTLSGGAGSSTTATTTPATAPTTANTAPPKSAPPTTVRMQHTTPPPTSTVTTPAPAPIGNLVGTGSANMLLSFRNSYVCTVTTTSAYAKRHGTLYLSNHKFYGDFTTSGSSQLTYMIDDSAYLYTWQKGSTTGIKLPAPSSVSGNVMVSHNAIDPNESLSYSCSPWTPDTGFFTPPSSVTFTN